MNPPTQSKYFIISLILLIVLSAVFLIYKRYFTFKIQSDITITDELAVKKYLGEDTFPQKTLKYETDQGKKNLINSIKILIEEEFIKTDDCVTNPESKSVIFCFADSASGNTMTISVYPNQIGLDENDDNYITNVLNFSIFSIFERRFGIDPKDKYVKINVNSNPVFKWPIK